MERQQDEFWSTLVLETLANESKPWCDSALSESIQPLSDTLMWRHASRWTVFQGKWREMQAEGSFNTAGIQLNKPHYQESRQTDRKPSHGVSGLGCHHQLISSGALTSPPRSRLGTKVEKQSSFHRRCCSSGFLFMSCSLGKPHSTFFRLPRWPFSSATKVSQESPSLCICDSIKLQKIAVLRIHQKNLHLPDIPGPTASYTDHQKSLLTLVDALLCPISSYLRLWEWGLTLCQAGYSWRPWEVRAQAGQLPEMTKNHT